MAEGGSRRGTTAMIVGVALVLAGAGLIFASQTVFAAKSVRITNFASGNAFALSDEQMLGNVPFADSIIGGGDGIRQRILKRRAGTALGAVLCCAGLAVGWRGLRRRRGTSGPDEAGAMPPANPQ
jgi:hypothetical protein